MRKNNANILSVTWTKDKGEIAPDVRVVQADEKGGALVYKSREIGIFDCGALPDGGVYGGELFRIQYKGGWGFLMPAEPVFAEFPADIVKQARGGFVINVLENAVIAKDRGAGHRQGTYRNEDGDFSINKPGTSTSRHVLSPVKGFEGLFIEHSNTKEGVGLDFWTYAKIYALDAAGKVIGESVIGYVKIDDVKRVFTDRGALYTRVRS